MLRKLVKCVYIKLTFPSNKLSLDLVSLSSYSPMCSGMKPRSNYRGAFSKFTFITKAQNCNFRGAYVQKIFASVFKN